uniref:Uncharacterized protein n=1 Tax=Tanacetum cinerariifolium TaxID=118510 RepID=A0A6L2JI45_TANCI|nr:hypothetical protein [Tanacetum cinerariifolium]
MQQTHISQASGSGADKGTGSIPGVLNVPIDESEEELSWNSTKDEGDDDEGKDGDGDEEDDGDNGEEGDGDDDEDDEGDDDDDDQEIKRDDEKDDEEDAGNGEEDLGLNVGREEGHDEEEEEDELYRDININQGRGIQTTQKVKDSHVTLTLVNLDGQQQSSSVSSQFMTSMLNPILDVAQKENDEFLKTIDENMHKIIKGQVKEQVKIQVSKILPKIKQTVNEQLEAKVLTRSSHSSKTSYTVAADLSEMELKKILIEKMEGNKFIQRSNEQRNLYKALVEAYEFDKIILDTYEETVTLKRRRKMMLIRNPPLDQTGGPRDAEKERSLGQLVLQRRKQPGALASQHKGLNLDRRAEDQPIVQSSQHPEWFSQQQKPLTLDHEWNKTLPTTHGSIQPWIRELTKQSDSRSSFNEMMDTPLDFSNFLINRLKVDTLTPELIAGPTYELLKGSCKSLVELEHHLEEVYKATTDQLDWDNPKGRKRQQFYGFAVNRESARDVYSKRRIITVTKLEIVEWHNYKHLDWITVRRDDDKLYKFKKGDFKRLRIQDIEDIDGTLTDVRTALDDRLKGIRIKYLPQSIWRKSDKDRAAAMIQAIDKRLKIRRIIRSLERFDGGRLYEGDFRMLQRTI